MFLYKRDLGGISTAGHTSGASSHNNNINKKHYKLIFLENQTCHIHIKISALIMGFVNEIYGYYNKFVQLFIKKISKEKH